MSTDTSYAAAKTILRPVILDGNTYANRDWIKQQGGKWNKATQQWIVPAPSNNQKTAAFLYALVQRGMTWEQTR